MLRGRLPLAGAVFAAGAWLLLAAMPSATAQSWPKAEIAQYAGTFGGKTYVMKLQGLGSTLVYAAPDRRAYVVRSLTSKVYPGSWEITYSMSNRSVAACIRGPGSEQCVPQSVVRSFPAKAGDIFGLAGRRTLDRPLPVSFGFADIARAVR
ncbi:hypothetical protein [Aurantimonas sp. HBX-1]|uniref:hypothetical protein n=1 Tax=Aurantimonas sp. HBX-1 TaxID=2906072 RepID=UPI001F211E09|nr:hypothetical protein [Aurantimonas sp. HBX-1]UIJ73743.1 hypothetical protein LXB15_09025 [Aurantimonas sp. HBX-1]